SLVRNTDHAAPVPSCPGWSAADLTWHLLEVQYFWASIVADLLRTPDKVTELVRPQDADLDDLFDVQTSRLLDALQAHDPAETCWSWHAEGHSVGWVLRRQAHEALIHRVDAELAHGGEFAVDAELAIDGVDEVLNVMLDSSDIPDWSSFAPDGRVAEITVNEGASWALRLGRFQGKSPQTGNDYDDPALIVATSIASPDAVVRGSGRDLNLWLWGRGTADSLVVEGDASVVTHIRAAAVAGTQ
ncbi:MAG: maleylpyruvate isomerase family mycothiol-dependent enzyme, partial [bacterium]|nr:maleylpyruvate isomerase family mycothiol-dependent enzyme [bacterium]